MNFEVLLQNITYICCNVLSCLPKFTEIALFACVCFFSSSDHVMFSRRKMVKFNKGRFRGGPKGPLPPPPPPPPPPLWFIKYFSITCLESRHLLNLSVQNAPDCISENFILKIFPGGGCARNSTVRSPDGRYRAHIATVYYISRPPLSQNPPSTPV